MLRQWIRNFVRDSILLGVEDACQTMSGDIDDNDTQQRIATLRLRLLPAPEQTEEPQTSKRRKAGGE